MFCLLLIQIWCFLERKGHSRLLSQVRALISGRVNFPGVPTLVLLAFLMDIKTSPPLTNEMALTLCPRKTRRSGIKAPWPYVRSICGPLLRKWQCGTLMRHRETRNDPGEGKLRSFRDQHSKHFGLGDHKYMFTKEKSNPKAWGRKNWLKRWPVVSVLKIEKFSDVTVDFSGGFVLQQEQSHSAWVKMLMKKPCVWNPLWSQRE